MSLMREFRDFAVKGNVIDLAIAVIIGAAFGKIVDSLVKDIIMPIIGKVFGGLDFSNYFIVLAASPAGYTGPMTYEALTKAGRAAARLRQLHYRRHQFHHPRLRDLLDGPAVRVQGKARLDTAPAPPAAPTEEVLLLREIRDSLRK